MGQPFDGWKAAMADRYVLERELGAGGMASVFLAHDTRHNRKVAIKVMYPELAAIIGPDRFLKEIETTANLQHPHILPLFDSGRLDGTVFYVMPYVQGASLRTQLARETQLPVADAIRIAAEIAAGLDYAHRHGVIHRDIKPDNVLFHDGRALVADFGIALAWSQGNGGIRLTKSGVSIGTPQYMSPEQACGEQNIDPRTDVYALGVVLYEMLAGQPPFIGRSAQAIIAQIMADEPRPLALKRKSVPPHVDAARYLANGFNLAHPAISPDGRWMAHDSDESGRVEVYAQSFPNPGLKRLEDLSDLRLGAALDPRRARTGLSEG